MRTTKYIYTNTIPSTDLSYFASVVSFTCWNVFVVTICVLELSNTHQVLQTSQNPTRGTHALNIKNHLAPRNNKKK